MFPSARTSISQAICLQRICVYIYVLIQSNLICQNFYEDQ